MRLREFANAAPEPRRGQRRCHDCEEDQLPSGSLGFPERLSIPWPELWETDGEVLRVEEYEDAGSLVIRAEIPDVDPEEDIEITIDGGRLHIRAERSERSEAKEGESYRTEFRYGSFRRSVPLPAGAAEDDVEASYRDGILEVRIPVVDDVEATKVPITR